MSLRDLEYHRINNAFLVCYYSGENFPSAVLDKVI